MVDKSKGPFVRQISISLTIAVISLCFGIIEAGGQEQLLKIFEGQSDDVFQELVAWRNICQNTAPFVGVILLTAITEFGGRKPALGIIIALTITASSLTILETKLCLKLSYVTISMSTGGLVLLYICITEYCEPKFRLAFSILTISLNRIGYVTEKLMYLYLSEVLPIYYMQYFNIFLCSVSLLFLLTWPESPHWLASKNKQEESRKSFLMLRRDQTAGDREFKATLDILNQNYSCKLYHSPLFIITILFLTFWCSVLFQNKQLSLWWIPDYSIEYQAVMECIVIFVIFKTVRYYFRFGSIVVELILVFAVIFQYAFVLLFYAFFPEDMMSDDFVLNMSMLVLFSVGYVLLIAGPITLSISKFAVHIPLKHRWKFVCISGLFFFLTKLILRYLAMFVEENFGSTILLLTLTTMSVLGMILCCFLMPKTKGKTLAEIEEAYLPKQ